MERFATTLTTAVLSNLHAGFAAGAASSVRETHELPPPPWHMCTRPGEGIPRAPPAERQALHELVLFLAHLTIKHQGTPAHLPQPPPLALVIEWTDCDYTIAAMYGAWTDMLEALTMIGLRRMASDRFWRPPDRTLSSLMRECQSRAFSYGWRCAEEAADDLLAKNRGDPPRNDPYERAVTIPAQQGVEPHQDIKTNFLQLMPLQLYTSTLWA